MRQGRKQLGWYRVIHQRGIGQQERHGEDGAEEEMESEAEEERATCLHEEDTEIRLAVVQPKS